LSVGKLFSPRNFQEFLRVKRLEVGAEIRAILFLPSPGIATWDRT
jgi:hypothetical protein